MSSIIIHPSTRMQICMVLVLLACLELGAGSQDDHCAGSKGLKFVWGDALSDSSDCKGPDGQPYPRSSILRSARAGVWGGAGAGSRQGRMLGVSSRSTVSPNFTRSALLDAYRLNNVDQQILEQHRIGAPTRPDRVLQLGPKNNTHRLIRKRRAAGSGGAGGAGACPGAGGRRLCRTRYNTTAPMYGVSLTSGRPVTIVQKFPDLLQQVVFEVCESKKCGVIRGACTQTYVPYLFLVLPLGPVTLTGQDYVLVESGCVCRTEDDPDIDLASESSQTSLNSVLP